MTEVLNSLSEINDKTTDIGRHIGEILSRYRQRHQLSQRHIAEMIGVSFQQYQKYEKGRDRLSLERAIMMCEKLHIPLTIFTEADELLTTSFAEQAQSSYGANIITDAQEKELLTIFRALPESSKKDFIELVKPIVKIVTNK